MRLWTVHPRYLDPRGLAALWREALLAKAVLAGNTRGYRNHPQLIRFRRSSDPSAYLELYLHTILRESRERGYRFDVAKAGAVTGLPPLLETRGQLEYEWEHLLAELSVRSPVYCEKNKAVIVPEPNPVFQIIDGPVRDWERRG